MQIPTDLCLKNKHVYVKMMPAASAVCFSYFQEKKKKNSTVNLSLIATVADHYLCKY